MRRKKPDKKYILALGALLAVTAIGGTFAYFSQDLSASNEFLTGKYDTEITEEFVPPADWQPGTEITKKVVITNKGNVDVVAVAKLTEECIRKEDITIPSYETGADGKLVESSETVAFKGEKLPTVFAPKDPNGNLLPEEEVGLKKFGTEVVEYDSGKQPEEYKGKWVYLKTDGTEDLKTPVYYFFYVGVIGGKETSPSILESVTMNPRLESTVTGTKLVADVGPDGENVYTFTSTQSEYGYDSVNYKLNIKAKTVQATKSAVDAVLGTETELPTELVPQEFDSLLSYVRGLCREDGTSSTTP